MKRRALVKLGPSLLDAAPLIASTDCSRLLYGTNAASAAAGWLLRSASTAGNIERLCYQNGVLIDCADLAADLGQ